MTNWLNLPGPHNVKTHTRKQRELPVFGRFGSWRYGINITLIVVVGFFVHSLGVDRLRGDNPAQAAAKQLETAVLEWRAEQMHVTEEALHIVEEELGAANENGAIHQFFDQLHHAQEQEKQNLHDLHRAEEDEFRKVLIPNLRAELQGVRDQLQAAYQINESEVRRLNEEITRLNQEIEAVHRDGLEAVIKIHQEQRVELQQRHEK